MSKMSLFAQFFVQTQKREKNSEQLSTKISDLKSQS